MNDDHGAARRASAVLRDAAAPTYDATAKLLHWLIAALVLLQFVVSILMPQIGRNTKPSPLIDLHFSLGVVILAVMAIRLVHRMLHPVPLLAAGTAGWERAIAQALHVAFYALLLVSPFLGWASADAHNLPVSVFGLVAMPAIAAPKARWALQAGDVHVWVMWTLLALIGLHALAALWHHFGRRDAVLSRMLPGRG